MNKSILLVILPCVVAIAVVQGMGYSYGSYGNMYGNMGYYQGQLQAHQAQTGYYNYGNQATAALRTSRLLNYCKFNFKTIVLLR